MAMALEERCSQEVINRDEAIKLLMEENESLEGVKAHLSEEVKLFLRLMGRLCLSRRKRGSLNWMR